MAVPVQWIPWEDRKHTTRRGPHQFTKRILHWPYCARCGLVCLKNDVSRAAMKSQCTWVEDD